MMVLLNEKFGVYWCFALGLKASFVNCTWWGKMSQWLWRSVSCLTIGCVPVIHWTSKGNVVDQLLLCILLFCLILKLLLLYAVSNLSLAAEVMYIPMSPGFWMIFPMIHVQGTTNDFDCCLHWLSIHVGKCSIAMPWFSQGLVGWDSLPLHL